MRPLLKTAETSVTESAAGAAKEQNQADDSGDSGGGFDFGKAFGDAKEHGKDLYESGKNKTEKAYSSLKNKWDGLDKSTKTKTKAGLAGAAAAGIIGTAWKKHRDKKKEKEMDKAGALDDMFSDENPLCDFKGAVDKIASSQDSPVQDGFSNVWSQILKTAVDHGIKAAARRVDRMEKNAGRGPYHDGMVKAAEMTAALRDLPEARGWYEFVKEAYDQSDSQEDLMKFASKAADAHVETRREIGYWGAAEMLCEHEDLVKIAWHGPAMMKG